MPFDEDSFRSASSGSASQNDSFKSTSRLLERHEDSFKRASSFRRSRLSSGAVETVHSRLSGGAVETVNALRLCAVAATTLFLLLLVVSFAPWRALLECAGQLDASTPTSANTVIVIPTALPLSEVKMRILQRVIDSAAAFDVTLLVDAATYGASVARLPAGRYRLKNHSQAELEQLYGAKVRPFNVPLNSGHDARYAPAKPAF